jgi:CO dehydrogenase nickel-insertion accessory protein CooC1
VRRVVVIGNKVANEEDRSFLEGALSAEDYLGCLPFNETIRRADREDRPLVDIADAELTRRFRGLWEEIKTRSKA